MTAASGALLAGAMRAAGIRIVATLPDAWLGPTIEALEQDSAMRVVRVAREEEGVGICAGAFLGGMRAAMLVQNGGFLLSVNALAGMALHHGIPVIMLLAQRGEAEDDQFYQIYKGRVTIPVLDALRIPWHRVQAEADLHLVPGAARQAWLARSPVAVLLGGRFLKGMAA